MWLVEDTLRAMGKREGATIEYWTPGGAMFGVKHYADKLAAPLPERGVTATFKKELIDIERRLIQNAERQCSRIRHMHPKPGT